LKFSLFFLFELLVFTFSIDFSLLDFLTSLLFGKLNLLSDFSFSFKERVKDIGYVVTLEKRWGVLGEEVEREGEKEEMEG
jgi:hypothetical protein